MKHAVPSLKCLIINLHKTHEQKFLDSYQQRKHLLTIEFIETQP